MSVNTQRSPVMMAPPLKLSRAFAAPEKIVALVDSGSPYKTITAVQKQPADENTPGWFRNFWALGGKVIFDGAEEAFHNPIFIDAAKKSFGAEIIQPLAMMTNLNVPAPAPAPHLDLPFFRGAHKREVPSWMLAPMGYSGLFQPWAIPVASAISWFSLGNGGGFEYWPGGLDEDSLVVDPPFFNTAVVADNEYMFHRVGHSGDEENYLAQGISSEALLHRVDNGWEIRLEDNLIRAYPDRQMRVSVLWKAYCFQSQADADAFNDPAFNLTPDQVVDIFTADLRKRGVTCADPQDLESDTEWMQVIEEHYGLPANAVQKY